MKLGKHISDLLYEHEQVLVPGLGTFYTAYMPARFIPEKKIVEAPRKEARFDSSLAEGETPLIDYIASAEGVEKDKVVEFLADVTSEIGSVLEHGKTVELENLGKLSKDPSGAFHFDPNPEINYLSDAPGVQEIRTPPSRTPTPVTPPGETGTKKEDREAEHADEPASSDAGQDNHTAYIEDTAAHVPDEDTPTKTPETMNEKNEKKKRPSVLAWLLILGIPILIILLILSFHFNIFLMKERIIGGMPFLFPDRETVAPVHEVDPDDMATIPDEEIKDPLADVPDKPKEVPEEEPPKITPEPGRPVYYLVVGSFRNPDKAEKLVSQLKETGADRASVLGPTPSRYHRVSYGFYYDLNEASARKQNLPPELREVAWILHR